MRKSTISSVRASHAGSLSAQNANAVLSEKKKELELLIKLESMSAEHCRRLDAIQLDCDVMADAGRVFGDVLSQWPEMFRILSLSATHLTSKSGENINTDSEASQNVERLVRLPLEELQQSNAQQ